jgi:hypothetical protein
MKPLKGYQITVKELQKNVGDRITDIYTEGDVTVVQIPNGRVKIMPDDKKPEPKYSLRNGGRKTNYVSKYKTEDKKGIKKNVNRKFTNRQPSR